MKIIQISVAVLPEDLRNTIVVFGLGKNNKIYIWNAKEEKWVLNI